MPGQADSATVAVEGTGGTTTSVTLGAGLWTAVSSVTGNDGGHFIVRLIGPSDSPRPTCWNRGNGVALADARGDETSVDSMLPLLVADGPDAWCEPGQLTLEVTASGPWTVVLTNTTRLADDGGRGGNVGGIVLDPQREHARTGTEPTGPVFVQISVGDRYACGVTPDSTVECWGYDNTWGQASPPTGEFAEVAAGNNHTCALAVGGEVRCWGDGYRGQTDAPEGVFTQVVTSETISCALRADGSFACWGSLGAVESPPGLSVARLAENGKCGLTADGKLACWYFRTSYEEPTAIEVVDAPAGTFTHVGDLCGVRSDGTVTCWGAIPPDPSEPPSGTHVQTSDLCGITTEGAVACWGTGQYGHANEPAEAPSGQYTQVSSGGFHACALGADGTPRCWGYNYGDGPAPPDAIFAEVSVGSTHPCGITADGRIDCWDRRYRGPAPAVEGWRAPEPGELSEGQFARISVGGVRLDDSMACAVRADGALACWDYGGPRAAPHGEFSDVSVGRGQTCALRTDGAVECWAWDEDDSAPSPPAQDRFTTVSATAGYACGVRANDALACWGADDRWPTDPPIGTFTQVSVSPGRACAVRSDARLHCWGWRADSLADRGLRTPANPPEGTFATVSVTGRYACGLRTDGSVECWGYGTIGRADPPDAHFAQISVGPHYACGVTTDGAVRCWG